MPNVLYNAASSQVTWMLSRDCTIATSPILRYTRIAEVKRHFHYLGVTFTLISLYTFSHYSFDATILYLKINLKMITPIHLKCQKKYSRGSKLD